MENHSIDFDICNGFRNKAGQRMFIETRGSAIMFSIENDGKRAEFVIEYNNKVISDDINKAFTACSSHATKMMAVENRERIKDDIKSPAGGGE